MLYVFLHLLQQGLWLCFFFLLPFHASSLLLNLLFFLLFCLIWPAYRFGGLFTLTHPSFGLQFFFLLDALEFCLFVLHSASWIFLADISSFSKHSSFTIIVPIMFVLCCAGCCYLSVYSGMSDQCFQSALKENWSVTFLFFYSGNFLGLVYFAAFNGVFCFILPSVFLFLFTPFLYLSCTESLKSQKIIFIYLFFIILFLSHYLVGTR